MKNNNKILKVLVIILFVTSALSIGYICYDKLQKTDNTNENVKDNEEKIDLLTYLNVDDIYFDTLDLQYVIFSKNDGNYKISELSNYELERLILSFYPYSEMDTYYAKDENDVCFGGSDMCYLLDVTKVSEYSKKYFGIDNTEGIFSDYEIKDGTIYYPDTGGIDLGYIWHNPSLTSSDNEVILTDNVTVLDFYDGEQESSKTITYIFKLDNGNYYLDSFNVVSK